MKFAIAALVATVAAQTGDDSAFLCETHKDCDDNFDALYEEWENNESDNKEGWEPKQGDMKCGKATLAGTDEETGESGSVTVPICIPSMACNGLSFTDADGNGIEIKEGACEDDDMEELSRKMVAGLA